MPFMKGQSGNPTGRPKLTEEEKLQRQQERQEKESELTYWTQQLKHIDKMIDQAKQEVEEKEIWLNTWEVKRKLREAVGPALERIIRISTSGNHPSQFKACKLIIDKAYGIDKVILEDDLIKNSIPQNIKITIYDPNKKADEEWSADEEEWIAPEFNGTASKVNSKSQSGIDEDWDNN